MSECHTDSRLAGCGGAALSPCVWFLLSARWWRCVLCWFWARWLPACLSSHSTLPPPPPHPHHHTRWSLARFPRLTSTPPARVRVPWRCYVRLLSQCSAFNCHLTAHYIQHVQLSNRVQTTPFSLCLSLTTFFCLFPSLSLSLSVPQYGPTIEILGLPGRMTLFSLSD